MVSMLLARSVSAVGGFLVLVLLSRNLSPPEYGNYFSLLAMAEILILASNLGLIHAAYRYVSADEQVNGKLTPYGPVWPLVGWRGLSLLAVAAAAAWMPAPARQWLQLDAETAALLPLLGVLVFGEGLARYVETIFDSMLCQGRSQLTLVGRTLLRLLGNGYFLLTGPFDLGRVWLVEAGVSVIGALAALLLLLSVYLGKRPALTGEATARVGFGRMVRYAFPAFMAQLLITVYGPDALKLVLSGTAGAAVLAAFGFAYSLAAVVMRYIPANILAGVFRPVFVAASAKENADALLSNLLGMTIKVNWLLILPIFCFVWFGGSPLLGLLSGGNYPTAGPILSVLILSLLALAARLMLSIYCNAKEISFPLLISTLTSTVGLPLGVFLAGRLGALGVAFAFGASELLWVLVCLTVLRRHTRGKLRLDWRGLGKMAFVAASVVIALEAARHHAVIADWRILAPLSAAVFCLGALAAKPFSAQERAWLLSVSPAKFSAKFKP